MSDTNGTGANALSSSGASRVVERSATGEAPSAAPVKSFATDTASVFGGEEERAKVVSFLQTEVRAAVLNTDRAAYMADVATWRRQRKSRPEKEKKDYPFPDAANVCPPLMQVKGNTIYARLLSNYSMKRPFWSGESDDPAFAPTAEALAAAMNYYSKSKFHANLKATNTKMFYDLVYFGTQFARVGWDMQRMKAGGASPDDIRYKRNTPVVEPIALEDFLTRTYWTDIQSMPWCGVHLRKSFRELVDKGAQGFYDADAVELVKQNNTKALTESELAELQARGITAEVNQSVDAAKFFDLYECYVFWDVDGDGLLEDVLLTFELESGTVLRAEVNVVGWRLFARLAYLDIPGQLYAVGVGHLLQLLQDEAETLRNMRLDAIRWTMMAETKAKKGSGVRPDEKSEPGKTWWVNDMGDVEIMQRPDMSQTTLAAEQIVMQDANAISGANEAMGGMADSTLKSGGGAEAQQVLMEQGFSVLNMYLENIDDGYTEIGRMLALVLHQNSALLDLTFLPQAQQDLLMELFAAPITDMPSRFRFNVETTDLARNEQSMKNNYIAFKQILSSYAAEVSQSYVAFQGAMQQGLMFLAMVNAKLIVGSTYVMEKMVEFLHIGSPADYLPDLTEVKGFIDGQQGQSGAAGAPAMAGQPGGANGAMGAQGPTGLGDAAPFGGGMPDTGAPPVVQAGGIPPVA